MLLIAIHITVRHQMIPAPSLAVLHACRKRPAAEVAAGEHQDRGKHQPAAVHDGLKRQTVLGDKNAAHVIIVASNMEAISTPSAAEAAAGTAAGTGTAGGAAGGAALASLQVPAAEDRGRGLLDGCDSSADRVRAVVLNNSSHSSSPPLPEDCWRSKNRSAQQRYRDRQRARIVEVRWVGPMHAC